MKQGIGLALIAAGALVVWAGVTNAGGTTKDGAHIPSLKEQVATVLKGGKPAPRPASAPAK